MSEQQVIVGDCQEVLRGMGAESAHCCVTSPPYWGLRDYGVDDQLGLESTPEEYLETMVDVFREVRRVLRPDATLWCNLGDSYFANTGKGFVTHKDTRGGDRKRLASLGTQRMKHPMKPKDLLGMPWRLALALQADGWWLRSDIIWHKPNPMPESCTDRPTKAHEYMFLLTKAANYFYDADAIRECNTPGSLRRYTPGEKLPSRQKFGGSDRANESFLDGQVFQAFGRNKRSVWGDKGTIWEIPTQPFSKAHFATFPEKLVEPCILAGTSDKGCCPKCGAPWKRIVEKNRVPTRPGKDNVSDETGMANRDEQRHVTEVRTTGWKAGCKCRTGDGKYYNAIFPPVPCTVIDPFLGSGTTLVVARKLGRDGVGIELSEEYAAMARKRIANPHPEPEVLDVDGQLTFGGAPDG